MGLPHPVDEQHEDIQGIRICTVSCKPHFHPACEGGESRDASKVEQGRRGRRPRGKIRGRPPVLPISTTALYLYRISTVSLLYRQLGAKGFMPCASSSNQGVGAAGQPARAPALYLCQSEQSPSLITSGSHGMTGLPDIRHRHRHRHRRRRSGHLGAIMAVRDFRGIVGEAGCSRQRREEGKEGGGPCSPWFPEGSGSSYSSSE